MKPTFQSLKISLTLPPIIHNIPVFKVKGILHVTLARWVQATVLAPQFGDLGLSGDWDQVDSSLGETQGKRMLGVR